MDRFEDELERRRRNDAERKRRSRKKRKAGLEAYNLYLPTAKIVAANANQERPGRCNRLVGRAVGEDWSRVTPSGAQPAAQRCCDSAGV